jgi:DNA-binding MarR family transcriptional regulator
MSSIPPERAEEIRSRQRSTAAIRDALRELRIQLALLNYRVGAEIGLRDADLDCLDMLDAYGPLSPSALARQAGMHPATMTGVLDRLERGGWIARERDPGDRRAVLVRVARERYGELLGHYTGMNRAMNKLLAGYADDELETIADFMARTAEAGRQAAGDLSRETS